MLWLIGIAVLVVMLMTAEKKEPGRVMYEDASELQGVKFYPTEIAGVQPTQRVTTMPVIEPIARAKIVSWNSEAMLELISEFGSQDKAEIELAKLYSESQYVVVIRKSDYAIGMSQYRDLTSRGSQVVSMFSGYARNPSMIGLEKNVYIVGG